MHINRIAAFSDNNAGGNPAGVCIVSEMPSIDIMLATAKEVGYSETAFLHAHQNGWRVRYFAPEMEVPFCGHATIATGAVLGERFGAGRYTLFLNDGPIDVTARQSDGGDWVTTLKSPDTWSKEVEPSFLGDVLTGFDLSIDDLDPLFPPRIAFAGARHLVLVVANHQKLKDMSYQFAPVRQLMEAESLITINLLYAQSGALFYSRNPFASGGVYEDPATGAAAAAFAGYLRDIDWAGHRSLEILQGQEMGCPSRLLVSFTQTTGEGVEVSGETRVLDPT